MNIEITHKSKKRTQKPLNNYIKIAKPQQYITIGEQIQHEINSTKDVDISYKRTFHESFSEKFIRLTAQEENKLMFVNHISGPKGE